MDAGPGEAPRIEQVLDVGVEEEFLLADRRDRSPAPRAAQVADAAARHLGDRVQREFHASQIELNSLPYLSSEALREDLLRSRRLAAAAARRADCLLLATGTAVLASGPPVLTADARFAAMADKYAFVEDLPSESNACHVHLGKLDLDEVARLCDRLRSWLPVLGAVAADSPFMAGRDHGRASNRYFLERRWPTVGPPPVFGGEEGYERAVGALVASGEILDRKMAAWHARPSEHLPTLEVRVADVNADVDLALLTAVLARGLGTTLLAELREGRPDRPVCDACLADGHREAAVHGLAGRWFDPEARRFAPLADGLDALVARARPGLAAAGDLETAGHLLDRLRTLGSGADRQRADFRVRGSLEDVVDGVAELTIAG